VAAKQLPTLTGARGAIDADTWQGYASRWSAPFTGRRTPSNPTLACRVSERQFKSWRSYWWFEQSVRERNRAFRTPDDEAFLKAVLASTGPFRETWNEGTILWRAQVGSEKRSDPMPGGRTYTAEFPFPAQRMFPFRDQATEGRANPKGIPCLYLATERDTAMGEVRPWKGSLVTVGQFKTVEDLRLVNLSLGKPSKPSYDDEPSPQEQTAAVWAHIDMAFSEPVTPDDRVADYAPTQVLAEMFRKDGADGIAYRSAVGKGLNVALFNLDAVQLLSRQLFKTVTLQYGFREATIPPEFDCAEQEDDGEGG